MAVTPTFAHPSAPLQRKVITSTFEGRILIANSGEEDGELHSIEIFNQSGTLLFSQECNGYSCQINLNSLEAGTYIARVVAANSIKKWQFGIN